MSTNMSDIPIEFRVGRIASWADEVEAEELAHSLATSEATGQTTSQTTSQTMSNDSNDEDGWTCVTSRVRCGRSAHGMIRGRR